MQATTPVPYYSTMKATGSTFLEYPEFPSVTGLTIRNILKKVFQLKKATIVYVYRRYCGTAKQQRLSSLARKGSLTFCWVKNASCNDS